MPRVQQSELTTTVDQWRDALAAATNSKYPDGKTLAELSKELGVHRNTLRNRLERACSAGKCGIHKDYRNNRLATVYVLEKKDGN